MIRLHKYLLGFISTPDYFLHRPFWRFIRICNYIDYGGGEDSRKGLGNEEGLPFFYKSKGQHILMNQRILDAIVRKSGIRPTDTVLEFGPGTGNLTVKLLEAAQKVIAVEIDERMVGFLHRRVAEHSFGDRLHVIRGDALKVEFPQFDLVVANIPYGISSPLVAKLVYGPIPFRSATLLLQKEFAGRLLANPGDSEFNRLAANVKLLADVEYVMDVSKRDFVPSPRVDSSVVIIRPKHKVPDVNLDEWRAFTRTCFCKKNKTLGATFKGKRKLMELLAQFSEVPASRRCNDGLESGDDEVGSEEDRKEEGDPLSSCMGMAMGIDSLKEKIVEVLKSGGFDDKRPSKLSTEELLRLLSLFNQAGIYFQTRSK